MKKTLSFFAALMITLGAVAHPTVEMEDTLAQKEFSLNVEELTLRVGETFQLELTWLYPELSSAYSKYITYSSGTDVVSVDDQGLIVARREGETYVYVAGNGVTHTCHVTVLKGNGEHERQRGRMTLPLGEQFGYCPEKFEVTLEGNTMRLQGTFWGHACVPSELEYDILDGAAYFKIHTSYEDSTCTDGWEGSFMVSQSIDVSFDKCTADVYLVYINNVRHDAYEWQQVIAYRSAANRYGTNANVDLGRANETQELTAEVGKDSIRISGYYYSNCGTGQYCIAEENNGCITLSFMEYGGFPADCHENHYVDFTIPRLADAITQILVYDSFSDEMQEVTLKIIASIATTEPSDSKVIYHDLTGRKVINPTRGIYIKDGRKVVIE